MFGFFLEAQVCLIFEHFSRFPQYLFCTNLNQQLLYLILNCSFWKFMQQKRILTAIGAKLEIFVVLTTIKKALQFNERLFLVFSHSHSHSFQY
jgi:hypothetical protein